MTKDRKKAATAAIVPQKAIVEEDIPEFMQKYADLGKENIGPEDVYPFYIPDVDFEGIIRKDGFDPFDALEMLLVSIITAHSNDRVSERLAEAKSALDEREVPNWPSQCRRIRYPIGCRLGVSLTQGQKSENQ